MARTPFIFSAPWWHPCLLFVLWFSPAASVPFASAVEPSSPVLALDSAVRDRCLALLRDGLRSDEFWPSMHAAEALTQAGCGAEVTAALAPRVATEEDAQHRCGLARELVRAGNLSQVPTLLAVLASSDPYGHVHACESLFKVGQVGDGELLRRALADQTKPPLAMMAAGALARGGNLAAIRVLRTQVSHPQGETARIAAWVLARVGDASDVPALRAGADRFSDPLTKAYFQHALAALGDPAGRAALVANLAHPDPAVRVYAGEFAPEARAVEASDALRKLLDDPVLDVRLRAAQALLRLAQPAPPKDEIIVADVFPATATNPRYSEGSLAVLADGRLLYATTEFIGSDSDFASARIIAVESTDHGRTWGPRRILQENVGRKNVMSVTLRRLSPSQEVTAPLGLFYLIKNDLNDLRVHLRVSDDEGKSFREPTLVTDALGYHVLNNDRVTVLASGRLVVPVASTADVGSVNQFACSCFLSDDQGRTWRRSSGRVEYARRGAMEPEVIQRRDGSLLMHFRTQLGHIAVSESQDQGETWAPPRAWNVRAPEAPSTLRKIPATGDWLLIWNDTFASGEGHGGKRTPLTAAVSSDEGRTWQKPRQLETSPDSTYAYTSVTFDGGRVHLTYYVRDEKSGRISSRFRSLPVAWFYQTAASP